MDVLSTISGWKQWRLYPALSVPYPARWKKWMFYPPCPGGSSGLGGLGLGGLGLGGLGGAGSWLEYLWCPTPPSRWRLEYLILEAPFNLIRRVWFIFKQMMLSYINVSLKHQAFAEHYHSIRTHWYSLHFQALDEGGPRAVFGVTDDATTSLHRCAGLGWGEGVLEVLVLTKTKDAGGRKQSGWILMALYWDSLVFLKQEGLALGEWDCSLKGENSWRGYTEGIVILWLQFLLLKFFPLLAWSSPYLDL